MFGLSKVSVGGIPIGLALLAAHSPAVSLASKRLPRLEAELFCRGGIVSVRSSMSRAGVSVESQENPWGSKQR